MKTDMGIEVGPLMVPAGNFASLRADMTGGMAFSVYPLTAKNMRELASELTACADKMDAAQYDDMRVSNAVRDAMWEAA